MSDPVPAELLVDCVFAQPGDGVWRQLLETYSPQAIEHAVIAGLNGPSPQPIAETLGFVRDLATLAPTAGCRDAARSRLHEEPILTRLRALIEDPAFFNRYNAVNTLGKIGAQKALPDLRNLFERRVDSDPLLLEGLVFEIRWLEASCEPTDHYSRRCLASPSPLTRWAGLDVVDRLAGYPEDDLWSAKRTLTESVRSDPDRRVATGAKFMLAEMEHLERIESVTSRPQKRHARKALEESRPTTFGTATIPFQNELSARGASDYTVTELEASLAAGTSNPPHAS